MPGDVGGDGRAEVVLLVDDEVGPAAAEERSELGGRRVERSTSMNSRPPISTSGRPSAAFGIASADSDASSSVAGLLDRHPDVDGRQAQRRQLGHEVRRSWRR